MPAAWTDRGTVLIRLGRHHFAFYRGFLDGIDLRALSRRYLETTPDDDAEMDLRVSRSMVKWIRDQLVVTAKRTGNISSAKLLRLEPDALRITYAAHVPTLEQFREERDPHEMFSERELIELFSDEFGVPDKSAERRTQRNARLRSKQVSALVRLEELAGASPHLKDGVDGWLDPVIATRLIDSGITTLELLVTAINSRGFRWYTKVPRIGVRASQQIIDWLMLPETIQSLGVQLSARGITPRRDLTPAMLTPQWPQTAIVPMENFLVPHEMDGEFGSNRGERTSLSARNDLEAINTWLSRYKAGSHTLRAYRKEAERFLLWSILEARKPISSLTVEDCISYRNFLWHLGRQTPEVWGQSYHIAQSKWMARRGIERFSPDWRPFEGPLSASSQRTALKILQSMMQWLTEQNYLHNNPLRALPDLANPAIKGIDATRSLTVAEWMIVKKYLDGLPRNQAYYRIRFILALAYNSGCRLSELASLKRGDLSSFVRSGEDQLQWEIEVIGKGEKLRRVQLNHNVVDEIRHYFRLRGHSTLRNVPSETPLIASLPVANLQGSSDDPLSASRLYRVLKHFFRDVASSVSTEDLDTADKLRRASTHWLRHTFATHGIHNGMTLETVRDLLGHKSLGTTSVYVTTEKDKRSREVEKLKEFGSF
nr:tyrosine-type recombinase/integrase [uncultured Noviherbaspirillum sp.]